MYLSFNNKSYLILFVSLAILLIQSNLPSVIVYNYNKINLDLVLVFLTVLVFLRNSYKIIIIGFLYGLIQDLIMGTEQLGVFSFIKSNTKKKLHGPKYVFVIFFSIGYNTYFLLITPNIHSPRLSLFQSIGQSG